MKITHVAEIVNITNVAGILEAEICGAENMRAVLMYNPLMLAAVKNHCDIINFLIQRGHPAQINSTTVGGNTALHNAAKKGCLEVVKCLVEQGADVYLKNKCKETPFDLANQNGQQDVIKYLLEKKKKNMKKKKIPLYNVQGGH